MKILLALMCSLAVGALGRAQSSAPDTAATDSTPPTAVAPKSAPVRIPPPAKAGEKAAEKSADKKAEPEKKEEPKIKGVVVPRGERGFLGVEIVGGGFKISFYDTKKKPKEPPMCW